jgi:serine/threonine protein phosphatase PrpC
MRLEISVLSQPGGREPNEDAFGCWSSRDASFCALSDGAGGHGGGDVASKLTVRAALGHFQASPQCSTQAIATALRAANEAIIAGQRGGRGVAHMRATAVLLAIDTAHAEAWWGHLGDSRLYCFRDGHVLARTKDHSVVQRMVDAGYIQERDLRRAPDRGRLFAALGADGEFDPSVTAAPLPVRKGDVFLLCSDGFWEYVDEQAMITTLGYARSAGDWLGRMEQQVVAAGDKDQDNYSALAVWCDRSDEPESNVAKGASSAPN